MPLEELPVEERTCENCERSAWLACIGSGVCCAWTEARCSTKDRAEKRIAELEKSMRLAAGFLITTNARFQGLSPEDVLDKLALMLANLKKEEQLTLAERVAKDEVDEQTKDGA